MAKGGVQSLRPGKRLAWTLESIRERGQDTSCSREKLSVKVQHTQKPLESRLVLGWRKGRDGVRVLLQAETSRGRKELAKKLNLGDSKFTLGEAYLETVLPAETEDLLEVVNVGGEVLAKDENVIDIDKTERQLTQDKVLHTLESIPCIPEAKRHSQKLKHTKGGNYSCLLDVLGCHWNLIIPLLEVKL